MSTKILHPRPEVEKISLTSSPSHHRRRSSGAVPLGSGLRCSISAAASSSSSDDATRFLKLGKRCGCTVSTRVLSEARGLVLFRVVRGGIGFTQRRGATGTRVPTGVWHTHPRTRASQEPTGHHQKKITGDGRGSSPETLKRLAILVCWRRNLSLLP